MCVAQHAGGLMLQSHCMRSTLVLQRHAMLVGSCFSNCMLSTLVLQRHGMVGRLMLHPRSKLWTSLTTLHSVSPNQSLQKISMGKCIPGKLQTPPHSMAGSLYSCTNLRGTALYFAQLLTQTKRNRGWIAIKKEEGG